MSDETPVTETPQEVSYVFAWHSLGDACPKCQRLNGREWREQDIFQETLFDLVEGDIWDFTADHTLAHPNCRCQLEVRVEFDMTKNEQYGELTDILELLL